MCNRIVGIAGAALREAVSGVLAIPRMAGRVSWIGVRMVCRVVSAAFSFLLLRDSAGVAPGACGLLIVACAIQVAVQSALVVQIAGGLAVFALQVIILRSLRWAHRPFRHLRELALVASVVRFGALVCRAFAHIEQDRRHWHSKAVVEGCADYADGSNDHEEVARGLDRLANLSEWMLKMIPTRSGHVFPFLCLGCMSLSVATIVAFSVLFYAQARAGIPSLNVLGDRSLLVFFTGSLAIFTSAPIGAVTPLGLGGLLLCGIEIVDALILVGLFLALVIQTAAYGSKEDVAEIDAAADKLDATIAATLAKVPEEYATRHAGMADTGKHRRRRG